MAEKSPSSGGELLPDGQDVSLYGKYEKWSYVRWAWEFLRRNKEFREACDKYRKMPEEKQPHMAEDIADRFHLKRFKDYIDGSWDEKKERLLFSRTRVWIGPPEGGDIRKVKTQLRTGQFLLLVDVNAMTSKREKEFIVNSFGVQIERLMEGREAELPKLSRKRDTGQMLLWLRMLDARFAKISDSDIYAMLEDSISYYSKRKKQFEDDPEGKIAERIRAAVNMASEGYIGLAFTNNKETLKTK